MGKFERRVVCNGGGGVFYGGGGGRGFCKGCERERDDLR